MPLCPASPPGEPTVRHVAPALGPGPGGPFPEQAHFVPVLIGRLVRAHSVLPTSEPCSLNEGRVAAAASW